MMNITAVSSPTAQHTAPQSSPAQIAFDKEFELASKSIDQTVDKFMASVFFYPLLQQLGDSPFKTEMFDGGFAEHAFRSRLNLRLADEIASSAKLDVSEVITQRLNLWLDRQPADCVKRLADSEPFDTIG